MADYFETGFTVRKASWHGKETVLDDYPENWDDARRAAGLLWEPRLVPLYTRRIIEVDADKNYSLDRYDSEVGELVPVTREVFEIDPNAQRVERDDTGEALAAVSGTFGLITHAQMGDIVDAVLESTNAKYETAGSVKGGRQVYCLVRLDEPYSIPGDVDGFGDPVRTYPYLAVLNSHDGTGAMKVLYTDVRVVCWNTVQAAAVQGDHHGAQVSLRHTSGVAERLDEVVEVLKGSRRNTEAWQQLASQLVSHRITDRQQIEFLDAFIPEPVADIVSDRVRENVARDRSKFLTLLRDSATNSAMAHNALGLYNAAIEFADHERGYRNNDTYMTRQILRAEPLKAKALAMVREVAGVAVR